MESQYNRLFDDLYGLNTQQKAAEKNEIPDFSIFLNPKSILESYLYALSSCFIIYNVVDFFSNSKIYVKRWNMVKYFMFENFIFLRCFLSDVQSVWIIKWPISLAFHSSFQSDEKLKIGGVTKNLRGDDLKKHPV